ncbi:non-hydrolyzing UDP-N-acetylglucosamine 2-epimerase [Tissierella creatinophila]|uniref:UDP-N-acetylglucosamine 2-epimerase (non-hydrolyzing) n=1 Tax=Tissierella creatinophila DSM 6911 TaxID=1123403 RepID=A0A1U7M612_TISCR|nr:UDP-N-acetylglucosamine 2-epimerase (non-hydrolyzing) [Tissierella creatinophila]OLS02628.1 UDP-N-acetylglucosamine 2-epimerase [Tissierella creatinophila DSM 6911]
MKKVKVLSIFGTRPEAIKMAPLVKELESNEKIESFVCVTAQHREMLDQVLEMFHIKPDFDLDIMKDRQTITSITTRSLEGLERVIEELNPDLVLVHGDTSTTFAGALAAFYHKVKVGHVEAGLRTYDKYSPYPEEMNRVLTGNIADLHFAPTTTNKENLLKENINKDIFITGNTVIDALNYTVDKDYIFKDEYLKGLNFNEERYILLTAHRRENLGEPLEDICNAVKSLIEDNKDINVIYPMHLNPRVRETVRGILGNVKRVHLIEPLEVTDMHNLMDRCFMIMTDSGGIQEEAPALGKPVLVLRAETERPEAVSAGTVKLVGVKEKDIFREANILLKKHEEYEKMKHAINPYGDGLASKRIVNFILYKFGLEEKGKEF